MIAVLCHVGDGADDGLQLVVVVVPLQQVQLSGAVRHTGPGKETSEWRAVEDIMQLRCKQAAVAGSAQAACRVTECHLCGIQIPVAVCLLDSRSLGEKKKGPW